MASVSWRARLLPCSCRESGSPRNVSPWAFSVRTYVLDRRGSRPRAVSPGRRAPSPVDGRGRSSRPSEPSARGRAAARPSLRRAAARQSSNAPRCVGSSATWPKARPGSSTSRRSPRVLSCTTLIDGLRIEERDSGGGQAELTRPGHPCRRGRPAERGRPPPVGAHRSCYSDGVTAPTFVAII